MTVISFLLSPVGRWLVGAALVLALIGGIYMKGHSDGEANVQAKWDAAVQAAIERGEKARADAERDVGSDPADGVRNDRFQRD